MHLWLFIPTIIIRDATYKNAQDRTTGDRFFVSKFTHARTVLCVCVCVMFSCLLFYIFEGETEKVWYVLFKNCAHGTDNQKEEEDQIKNPPSACGETGPLGQRVNHEAHSGTSFFSVWMWCTAVSLVSMSVGTAVPQRIVSILLNSISVCCELCSIRLSGPVVGHGRGR